ncbi:hypothetical protein ACCQ12_15155 [Xanthomonas sp. NCPPB 1068]|uniref:TipJ family phage tail tip protein n=1 Tax=Xanthomonas sp. NCPPB 1068 TaxID=487525 RepID=UPI00355759ED
MILRTHPLAEPGCVPVAAGQTLLQMLNQASGGAEISDDIEVRVAGYIVPRAWWGKLRPKAGACITVTRNSLAGSGGGWKQILGAVVLIVVAWFAPYLGGAAASAAGFGTAATWGAAITLAASLAVNALIAPPTPSGGSNATAGQWNQLTGSSNSYNPWGVIPFVIGDCRLFPTIAAVQYNEVVGENAYFHCMFDLGHGDIEVSEIKIGDTSIESYDDVQYEVTRTPTLYTNDVFEASVGSSMENGDVVQRTTSPGTQAISIDIVHPQGLFGVGTSNKTFGLSNAFKVLYRQTGTTAWLQPTNVRWGGLAPPYASENIPGCNAFVSKESKKPFSAGMAWDVPAGQYDVQVTRLAARRGSADNTYVDACTWAILRSVKYTNPSTTGTWKLAMRIKGTDQLTGTLQTVSCRVRQRVKIYSRAVGTWSAPQPCTNAAWNVYWLMRECPALSVHVDASRIDLDSFADYAEWVEAKGFTASKVCDSATTAWELIKGLLAGSLGRLGNRNGKYCIVYDSGEQVRSMSFSPLDTKNLSISRTFTDLPHALRVQFKNPAADWQEDEIIVLDDGYSYRGVDARGNPSTAPEPSLYETLKIEQEMDAFQAWQLARYHMGQGKFRQNNITWRSDIAGLGVTSGDLVDVAHDVTEWGTGWGRVLRLEQVTDIPGATALIVLDESIETVAGSSYSAQLRLSTGDVEVVRIIGAGGLSNVFALQELPTDVRPGDACIVGLTNQETKSLLVTSWKCDKDLNTTFSAVENDPRMGPYWADPPTEITSEISGALYDGPDDPEVIAVVSNLVNGTTDDAGIRTPRVSIGLRKGSGFEVSMVMQ